MPPKVISLHGHHHWNEHVRDTGRCRFANFKNETYVIMLRWSKTKLNILSTYTKVYIYILYIYTIYSIYIYTIYYIYTLYKLYIYTKVYTKYYELTVIDLWNFMRSKANDVV